MRVITDPDLSRLDRNYCFVRHIEGELEATVTGVTLRFENVQQAVMLANAIIELTTGPRGSIADDSSPMTLEEFRAGWEEMHRRGAEWLNRFGPPPATASE